MVPTLLDNVSFVVGLIDVVSELKMGRKTTMATRTKIKLRTCDVCGIKKKVAEFSIGKICNKCDGPNVSTPQELTDDEIIPKLEIPLDLQSLHAKMDHLHQRFDRMETLVIGLMELVGKINYDMEMNKIGKDE